VDHLPFPRALELFEFWQSFPPANETNQILAQATTTWKPKPIAISVGRGDADADDNELRNYAGAALMTGSRTKGAKQLPDFMKRAMNEKFGLNIQ
jgi:hypothetical protein